MKTRTYHQGARAAAAAERTERIRTATLELFLERPYDQITLASVAERAGVGLQTLIRRVGTKDGLIELVNEWIGPQVAANLGPPTSSDPATVAAAFARHYDRWALLTDRTLRQTDTSPILAATAEGGRKAHRAWISAAFADRLERLPTDQRRRLRARLVGVCGVELWLVLTREEGLSPAEARDTVTDLIAAALSSFDHHLT